MSASRQNPHGWLARFMVWCARRSLREERQTAAAAHDPPDLVRLERELKESQERLKALFNGVETGIFLIDPETHILVEANQVAAEMVGLPTGKIVGCSCHKFVCPAEHGRCPVTDLGQSVDNSERVLLTARGERRSIIKTVRPVSVSGIPLLLESFVDITGRKSVETALNARTAYLDSLIEVSPLGIAVENADRRIEISNAAFERLFQFSRAETRGANLDNLIVPAELAVEAAALTQKCVQNGSAHATTRRRRKDGTLVDVRIFSARLEIDGKPGGLVALYEDITAQIEAEKAMAERHRLSEVAAAVGAALTRSDGLRQGLQKCAEILVRDMDVAFARVWTVNEQEKVLELQASAGLYTHTGGAHARVPVGALKIGRIAAEGEPHLTNSVPTDSWVADPEWARREGMVSFAGYPLKMGERVLGVVAAFARRPLTGAALQTFASIADSLAQFIERKRAEESLRQSEDQFRTAFEEAPYGMCLVAPDGRFLHANLAFSQMLGYTREELMAGAWQQITHPEDLGRSIQGYVALNSRAAATVELEKRYLHKSGRIVWVRLKISPIASAGGKPAHYIAQIEDITLRRQANEAQAFLASLVEASQDAIAGETVNGTVVSWNRGAQQLYGYTAEEMIGSSIARLVPPARLDEFRAVLEEIGHGEQTLRYETVRLRKDGTPVDVIVTVSPVRDAAGRVTGIAMIAHDITARKRAERTLRESEQRYRELFENATEIIFTTDLQGRFTSMNLAGQRLSGYSLEEIGKTDIWHVAAPEFAEVMKADISRMLAGETGIRAEIEVNARDGGQVKLEVKPRLIFQDSKPVGIQAIARDITGRDQAEVELRQTQKLESVGRLAAGIAHEINTPIQFVGDNVRFLRDCFASLKDLWSKIGELRDAAASGQARPDLAAQIRRVEQDLDLPFLAEEIPKALAQTLEGVERVATIVRAMKEFAHPESREMAAADLNKALISTMTVARNELKYVARIETDFGELPLVVCNVSDLNQVFLNLLVNAAHAIGDVVEPGEKGLITVRTALEGDRVLIGISDTGSGIPENIRANIFDPFFTTKEVGRGTGQGLAIARSVVVEKHKGSLTFESEVGKGTTFYIRLPVSQEEAAAEAPGADAFVNAA